MQTVGWAILGPGQIAQSFAEGLVASRTGRLAAVGSSDAARARAFAERFAPGGSTENSDGAFAGHYDAVLGRDDVDAVYIGTVHPAHAALAAAALRAGKAVLCEKPLTPTAAETDRLLAVAADADRPLVEAYKNRFSPFARELDALVGAGAVGAPRRLTASFGFASDERAGRLFDPELAGGALLDVGCYPLSLTVQVAAAAGIDPATLRLVEADGRIGPTGVDEDARAVVAAEGFEAHVSTSIRSTLPRSAEIVGTAGTIELPDAWGSRSASASTIVVRRADASGGGTTERAPEQHTAAVVHPFAAEADAVARLLDTGAREASELPWAHTRAIARLLDAWAAALRAA